MKKTWARKSRVRLPLRHFSQLRLRIWPLESTRVPHKIVCQVSVKIYSSIKFLWTKKYIAFLHMKTQKIMTCFSLPKTPRILITLGNEQCVKLLLGVCNTKKRGDLSLSLVNSNKYNIGTSITGTANSVLQRHILWFFILIWNFYNKYDVQFKPILHFLIFAF